VVGGTGGEQGCVGAVLPATTAGAGKFGSEGTERVLVDQVQLAPPTGHRRFDYARSQSGGARNPAGAVTHPRRRSPNSQVNKRAVLPGKQKGRTAGPCGISYWLYTYIWSYKRGQYQISKTKKQKDAEPQCLVKPLLFPRTDQYEAFAAGRLSGCSL
jgi:hypothetical protein